MNTNPETTNNRRFYGHGIPGVQLEELTGKMPKCEYRAYLSEVVTEAKRLKI